VEYIDRKVCYLAESLVLKGEFLSWRKFTLPPLSIPDIEITPICNRQSDRLSVEKIIATHIIDSHQGKDASTIYIIEVLVAVSNVSSFSENDETFVTNDSNNSFEQPVTFTICYGSDESFILLDVTF
jgi:hypothetical protein